MRQAFLVVILAVAALAQRAEPKRSAAEYPAHAEWRDYAIGVEFLGRSALAKDDSVFLRDFLVLDVAVYPANGKVVTASATGFALRINGKKALVPARTAGYVAAAVKYDDWERRPTLVAAAGVGDGTVVVGQPRSTARFPGDRRPVDRRLPDPVEKPDPVEQRGVDPNKRAPEALVTEEALVEDPTRVPVRGLVYFAHKGKMKDVKRVELVCVETGESLELKLP